MLNFIKSILSNYIYEMKKKIRSYIFLFGYTQIRNRSIFWFQIIIPFFCAASFSLLETENGI